MKIPFNIPFLTGNETEYIKDAVISGKISGNGKYTKKCQSFFEKRYGFKKCLLTSSCTDALEMTAILMDVGPSDEIILPSYTFVSSANAFVLRGAKLVFADSNETNPNIDVESVKKLITPKTKAIVVVHYAGIACDMDGIMDLAKKYDLFVVEDAAHAIDSFYKGKPLGSIGHFSTFSFHETKNIISGEGGMLVVNDERFFQRAEVIWEKGTNRSAFFRGEVDKYNWIDIGSSFLPSEVISAFLLAQLESLDTIQKKRKNVWEYYHKRFSDLALTMVQLPQISNYATNNAHMYYMVCDSLTSRNKLIQGLKKKGIWSVFHYLPLHESPFYSKIKAPERLKNCSKYANCLIRLPFYFTITKAEQDYIINEVAQIVSKHNKCD